MDNRPIGVFDSGLGGLTGVKELRKRLPHENIVYFVDTGPRPLRRAPEQTGNRKRFVNSAPDFLQFFLPSAMIVKEK